MTSTLNNGCILKIKMMLLRYTQPGHPSVGSSNSTSTSKSWDVSRHTVRCIRPKQVVSQCKLVSGWELRKWNSAPPYRPCGWGRTLHLRLHNEKALPHLKINAPLKLETKTNSVRALSSFKSNFCFTWNFIFAISILFAQTSWRIIRRLQRISFLTKNWRNDENWRSW